MQTELAAFVVLLFVVGFGALSRPLTRGWLSGPLVFTAFGLAVGSSGLDILVLDPRGEEIRVLAELTLVLVLFTDASRIRLHQLRPSVPARLLGIGMPLTILTGWAAALVLFPALNAWEAGALAAVLTPTDAALGQAVVSNPEVREDVREGLTVESGLNDGIALPIVLVFLALAVGSTERSPSAWTLFWVGQITLGPLLGAATGAVGGRLLLWASGRHLLVPAFERIAGLALGLLTFVAAEAVGGNGLIAAFVGGFALGNAAPTIARHVHDFLETEGKLLMLSVFVLLGSALVGPALGHLTWAGVAYAFLSLTVVRGVPVALSMTGSGFGRADRLFMGWFGPRGLASVLFGLLLVEGEDLVNGRAMFDVVVFTVLCSVVLHGVTATAGTRAYVRASTVRRARP